MEYNGKACREILKASFPPKLLAPPSCLKRECVKRSESYRDRIFSYSAEERRGSEEPFSLSKRGGCRGTHTRGRGRQKRMWASGEKKHVELPANALKGCTKFRMLCTFLPGRARYRDISTIWPLGRNENGTRTYGENVCVARRKYIPAKMGEVRKVYCESLLLLASIHFHHSFLNRILRKPKLECCQ